MYVLYIPGKGTSRANYPYDKILRKIQRRGHNTQFCHMNWPRSAVVGDWLDQARPAYAQCDPSQTIVVGFSIGAMLAFLLAAQQPPAGLVLCSVSPYFAEDLSLVPMRWIRQLTPERHASFKKLYFDDVAPAITCPTRLVIGGREPDWAQQRTQKASAALPGGDIFAAKNAGHTPAMWSYIQALNAAFDSLRTDLPTA